MNSFNYWLSQWVDEQEISADWEIENALNSPAAFERLLELLNAALVDSGKVETQSLDEPGESIVAGSAIDLSGLIGCNAFECMKKSVDNTFKNVWHYFDRVVVQGSSPASISARIRSANSEDAKKNVIRHLATQIRLILYLESIGAADYVYYANKPHLFCEHHWQKHAKELGIEDALDPERQKKIVARMLKDSGFETIRIGKDFWGASLWGPGVGARQSFTFTTPGKPSRKSVARYILSNYARAMISDIGMSRELQLPLIHPTGVPWVHNHPSSSRLPMAESVALELNLPILENLSTADFLKLRKDEQPHFDRFRNALRQEIQQRLVPENLGKSAGEIAHSIETEVLRPKLAEIEVQARASRKAVVKSSVATLAIGSVSASLGALTSFPWLMAAGGAIGTAPLAPLINKYINDMNVSIPMSEFYFLWKAQKHSGH